MTRKIVILFILLIILVHSAADSSENNNNSMITNPEENNTPAGINVTVKFVDLGLNVTFANVTQGGQTSINPSTTYPIPPDGFNMVGNYYNISTTAKHKGDITICINYDDSEVITENALKLFHHKVEENEFFAYVQSGINSCDTIWNLTGESCPGVLCSDKEKLNFVIDSSKLEINGTGDNFVYDTSIYSNNGETQIGWLGEPFSVVENGTVWYLSKLLCNENQNDIHQIRIGRSLTLPGGFIIEICEIDTEGGKVWFDIDAGQLSNSLVVEEGTHYFIKTDLNESGSNDNWVLKFNVEAIFGNNYTNLVNINKIQLRSPEVMKINTPNTYIISGSTITSEYNDNTLEVRLKSADNSIPLEKGGTINLLCEKFKFQLDEDGDTGGILNPSGTTSTWLEVNSSQETDQNIICGIVTNLSEFIIAEEIDINPPVINNVTINTTTPYAGSDILITVNATDNFGVVSVSANKVALTHQGNDIWTGTITAQLGYDSIRIKAIDVTGFIRLSSVSYPVRIENNTPIGTSVQVTIPEYNMILTFANVTHSGQTYVSAITADPPMPFGYYILSDYYNIITTAKYTGNIFICFRYNDTETVDGNNVKILQYKEIEDQTEIFAIQQENISIGDTIWNLTAADYPEVLCEGSMESLSFIIDGTSLEINASDDNFVYSTSIYSKYGNWFIAWLNEPMYFHKKFSKWYLATMLIGETQDDTFSLKTGESMNLVDGFAITPLEDDDGIIWFYITKDGKVIRSWIVKENRRYYYSNVYENWYFNILKFKVDTITVGPEYNLINISGLKLISPDLFIFETPNEDILSGFNITSHDYTLQIKLNTPDDKIRLIKGGVVNLIGDKFRFKLDEEGNVGGILNRPEIIQMWDDITISQDNSTNTICGIGEVLSTFIIAQPYNNTSTITINSATVDVNDTITIPVTIVNVKDVECVRFNVSYDPGVAEILNITANSAIPLSTVSYTLDTGSVAIELTNPDRITVTDATPLVDITFQTGENTGTTALKLQNVELVNTGSYAPDTIVNGSITVCIKGDFNNNNRVDIGDAAKVAFMVAGKVDDDLRADFNHNGRVDIGDAAKISFYLAQKVNEL